MGRSASPHASQALSFLAPKCGNSTLALRILFVLLLLAVLHEQHYFSLYRRELAAKYSSTKFDTPDSSLWRTQTADPGLPHRMLAHRKEWKILGAGWEGSTFVYNGSVIKTFTPGQSPFRNCALGHPSERWPTEIPASLEIGGIWRPENELDSSSNQALPGFLPVQAHFMAASSPNSPSEWHLVTPLLPGGNLNNLAKRLHKHQSTRHFRQLDSQFRPAFHQILYSLQALHERGFCHDDIKPANVFLRNDTEWLLGDLGNVREKDHPYHSSRLWVQDNRQLSDCRSNDVFRALKSYLSFIRAASSDQDAFDAAFFEDKKPLSKLFWRSFASASSLSAARLRRESDIYDPEEPAEEEDNGYFGSASSLSFSFLGRRRARVYAVEKMLETKFSERRARWAGLTWFLGVPVEKC